MIYNLSEFIMTGKCKYIINYLTPFLSLMISGTINILPRPVILHCFSSPWKLGSIQIPSPPRIHRGVSRRLVVPHLLLTR